MTVEIDPLGVETLSGDARLWQIYETTFPSSEREPKEVILESLRRGAGLAVRARQAGATIGFATGHLLAEPPVVFLVYLAVEEHRRDQRFGEAIFEGFWEEGSRRCRKQGLTPLGMVWEVEIPEAGRTEEEIHQRKRRIHFFERMGGNLLRCAYNQPPVDGIRPVAMHLMFRPARGTALPEAGAIAAMVRAMYYEKYGEVNGISREILDQLLLAR